MLFIVALTGCSEIDTSADTYEKFAAENGIMPTIDSLSDCRSVQTMKYERFDILPAYTLIAEYDAEHYPSAVNAVNEKYTFQMEPMTDKVEGNKLNPTFSYDGYDFSVLNLKKYCKEDSEFPEELYFIGINREERKIAYVYFYDQSLDVASSLEHILTYYCGWSKIP
ncbi:MAG: hypothetical protein IJ639_11915 [Ruminococcus sp.]|nr:hypothetical protein [Ruminococcus sp.]